MNNLTLYLGALLYIVISIYLAIWLSHIILTTIFSKFKYSIATFDQFKYQFNKVDWLYINYKDNYIDTISDCFVNLYQAHYYGYNMLFTNPWEFYKFRIFIKNILHDPKYIKGLWVINPYE